MSTRRRLLVAGWPCGDDRATRRQRRATRGAAGSTGTARKLAGGAGSGSAIGPGGALYVPQPAAGGSGGSTRERREDAVRQRAAPRFAALPFGGVMDVAFYGSTAYALVSVVGSDFPTTCSPAIPT